MLSLFCTSAQALLQQIPLVAIENRFLIFCNRHPSMLPGRFYKRDLDIKEAYKSQPPHFYPGIDIDELKIWRNGDSNKRSHVILKHDEIVYVKYIKTTHMCAHKIQMSRCTNTKENYTYHLERFI